MAWKKTQTVAEHNNISFCQWKICMILKLQDKITPQSDQKWPWYRHKSSSWKKNNWRFKIVDIIDETSPSSSLFYFFVFGICFSI